MEVKLQENRVFPRMAARCPVLYREINAKQWHVAKLVDFSATGLRMECDDNLGAGTLLAIQIKPGSNKVIPALTARGEVVRSEINAQSVIEVSCKLTKISAGK